MIKISIITVNFNNLSGLQKTMKSVLCQKYTNMEYIIIDGGSTDGSKEFIISHKDKLSYWCSEKDKGIYDGMNKGIARATGEYLLFLNSGDYFSCSTTLNDVFRERKYDEDLLIGRQLYINNLGKKGISPKLRISDFSITYFLSSTIPHQATFIKRDLFEKIGYYDINYKVSADWVFWIKAIIENKCTIKLINERISYMEVGGISADMEKCYQDMSKYMEECLHNGNITWQDIFKYSTQGRMQEYCSRNKLLNLINKIIVGIGKRI